MSKIPRNKIRKAVPLIILFSTAIFLFTVFLLLFKIVTPSGENAGLRFYTSEKQLLLQNTRFVYRTLYPENKQISSFPLGDSSLQVEKALPEFTQKFEEFKLSKTYFLEKAISFISDFEGCADDFKYLFSRLRLIRDYRSSSKHSETDGTTEIEKIPADQSEPKESFHLVPAEFFSNPAMIFVKGSENYFPDRSARSFPFSSLGIYVHNLKDIAKNIYNIEEPQVGLVHATSQHGVVVIHKSGRRICLLKVEVGAKYFLYAIEHDGTLEKASVLETAEQQFGKEVVSNLTYRGFVLTGEYTDDYSLARLIVKEGTLVKPNLANQSYNGVSLEKTDVVPVTVETRMKVASEMGGKKYLSRYIEKKAVEGIIPESVWFGRTLGSVEGEMYELVAWVCVDGAITKSFVKKKGTWKTFSEGRETDVDVGSIAYGNENVLIFEKE